MNTDVAACIHFAERNGFRFRASLRDIIESFRADS
jgi:hypothetical protein